MPKGCCPGDLLRRIGFFALLGFAALFLTGPIIAVISVVISLALVAVSFLLPLVLLGLLIGIPLKAFGKRTLFTWSDLRVLGVMVRDMTFGILRRAGILTGKILSVGRSVNSVARSKVYFIGGLLLEILCGALVGAFVGAISELPPHPIDYLRIAFCAAIGAMLGLLVGISRMPLARDSVSNHPA